MGQRKRARSNIVRRCRAAWRVGGYACRGVHVCVQKPTLAQSTFRNVLRRQSAGNTSRWRGMDRETSGRNPPKALGNVLNAGRRGEGETGGAGGGRRLGLDCRFKGEARRPCLGVQGVGWGAPVTHVCSIGLLPPTTSAAPHNPTRASLPCTNCPPPPTAPTALKRKKRPPRKDTHTRARCVLTYRWR